MKRQILSLIFACCLAAGLSSCDDFLDIQPKGATLLDNLNDLELLVNGSYSQSAWSYGNMEILVNDSYGTSNSFLTTLAQTNTIAAAMLTYNESIDRVALTESDAAYTRLYSVICSMNEVYQRRRHCIAR